MTRQIIPRRRERKPILLGAHCRTQSGMRDTGFISDISSEGCCVTTNSLFFKVGTRVVIRPDGMEGLTGVIRWIIGDKAGIQFDQPVYEPVVDHLAARHGVREEVTLESR